jgi:hypothetical protein
MTQQAVESNPVHVLLEGVGESEIMVVGSHPYRPAGEWHDG